MHRRLLIALVPLIVAGQGCVSQSDKDAQQLAGRLHRITMSYRSALTAKVAAEEAFYKRQLDNLSRFRDARASSVRSTTQPAQDPTDITYTVPYGQISNAAIAGSASLAEQLIASPVPPTRSEVAAFIHAGVEADVKAYLENRQRRQALRIDVADGLAKLEVEQGKLKKLTDELAALEKGPGVSDRLKDLAALGRAAVKQFEEGQKSPSTSGKTPATGATGGAPAGGP